MFSRDAKQHGQHVATVWQLDCGITLHPFGFGWFTIGYVLRSCGCWALFGISSCIQSLNPDNRNGIGQSCCIFQVPDGSRCVPYEKPSWLPHVVTPDLLISFHPAYRLIILMAIIAAVLAQWSSRLWWNWTGPIIPFNQGSECFLTSRLFKYQF